MELIKNFGTRIKLRSSSVDLEYIFLQKHKSGVCFLGIPLRQMDFSENIIFQKNHYPYEVYGSNPYPLPDMDFCKKICSKSTELDLSFILVPTFLINSKNSRSYDRLRKVVFYLYKLSLEQAIHNPLVKSSV